MASDRKSQVTKWRSMLQSRNHHINWLFQRSEQLSEIPFTSGFYKGHLFNLSATVKTHHSKWKPFFSEVTLITKGTCVHFVPKCLSMTQLVVCMLTMKCRLIFGSVPDNIMSTLSELFPHSINPHVDFLLIIEKLCHQAKSREFVACRPVQSIYRRAINAIFSIVHRKSNFFESKETSKFLADLFECKSQQIMEQLYDAKAPELLCFGTKTPAAICAAAGDTDPMLQQSLAIISRLERGDFVDLTTLLLQVQLTCRIHTTWSTHEHMYMDSKFKSVVLDTVQFVDIVSANSRNALFHIFNYPKSLYHNVNATVYVVVKLRFGGVEYFPVLNLWVVSYLFGSDHKAKILAALQRVMLE